MASKYSADYLGNSLSSLQMSDLFFNYGVKTHADGPTREHVLEDAIEWSNYFTFSAESDRNSFVDALVDNFMNRV